MAESERTAVPEGPYLEVAAALGPPDAVLVASPSKSATHRAILLGLLTPHTVIENPLISADTVASLRLAGALGARTSAEPITDAGTRLIGRIGDGIQKQRALDADAHTGQTDVPASWDALVLDATLAATAPAVPRPLLAAGVRLHIEGPVRPMPRADAVDVANSGTTLRIGTALAALGDRAIRLSGDDSLHTRPMGPLVAALRALGAQVECSGKDERPPVTVKGPLKAGEVSIRGDISSQYITALLVAAQALDAPTTIRLSTPLRSRPYVDVTRRMVAAFGGTITYDEDATGARFTVPGRMPRRPVHHFVAGDWSSAAFPLVAAVITGGRVTLAGLERESDQGDRVVLDVLAATGAEIEWISDDDRGHGELLTVTAPVGRPRAFTHAFTDTPDLFPPLAALAARCRGTSELTDCAHVRLKECDRVAAMATGLTALGVTVDERSDAMTVEGAPDLPLAPTWIETHDDHRILMAFSVLALAGPGPLYLTHPSCYHVSYPRFRMDIDALGGATRVAEREAVLAATEASR